MKFGPVQLESGLFWKDPVAGTTEAIDLSSPPSDCHRAANSGDVKEESVKARAVVSFTLNVAAGVKIIPKIEADLLPRANIFLLRARNVGYSKSCGGNRVIQK
jgi:hypothetical protein